MEPYHCRGGPAGQRGGAYVREVNQSGIESVCGGCPRIHTRDCYAQHSARNAGQTAKMIARAVEMPDLTPEGVYRFLVKLAHAQGVDSARFYVSGDGGALPEDLANFIHRQARADFRVVHHYTHAWKKRGKFEAAPWLRGIAMASTETQADLDRALRDGWAPYHAVPLSAFDSANTIEIGDLPLCPKSAEAVNVSGVKVTCGGCPHRCDGFGPAVTIAHSVGDASRKRGKRFDSKTITSGGSVIGSFRSRLPVTH